MFTYMIHLEDNLTLHKEVVDHNLSVSSLAKSEVVNVKSLLLLQGW